MKKKKRENICVITGGTRGIGYSLVKKFVEKKFNVIVIGRKRKNFETGIKKFPSYERKKILFYKFDLSEPTEFRELFNRLKKKKNIKILFNNAGAIFKKKILNKKKLERTFTLNYLCPFYLTLNFAKFYKTNTKIQIINMTSFLRNFAKINLSDVFFKKKYNPYLAYANSKLMNAFLTYEINKRYAHKIKCYSYEPGFVNTNFGNDNKSFLRKFIKIIKFYFGRNPNDVASEITSHLFSNKKRKLFYSYINKNKIIDINKIVKDKSLSKNLFTMSKKLISQS